MSLHNLVKPGPKPGYEQIFEHVNARTQPRVWTPRMRWDMQTMLEHGQSDAAIGRALGVTAFAVQVARKRYGITARKHTAMS